VKLSIHTIHAPGLTRGLSRTTARGPGSGPGNVSLLINRAGAFALYVLRLHYGVSSGWGFVYRNNQQPCSASGATSLGSGKRSYGEIQYQDAGLVRTARRFPNRVGAGAPDETMASEVENSGGIGHQSRMAGSGRGNTTGWVRPRVRPGASLVHGFLT
jgi:hypothetical protein